jgi:predicted small secreted protein
VQVRVEVAVSAAVLVAGLVLAGCRADTMAGAGPSSAEPTGGSPAQTAPPPEADAVPTAPALPALPPAPPAPPPDPPPPDPVVPDSGPGTFAVASGTSAVVGTGLPVRYTVEVETGLPFDPAGVAGAVDATFADPRSWTADGRTAFQRVDAGGDLRVLVTTPATTDRLCAPLRTRGEVSCRQGDLVVLNAKRWALGIEAYAGALEDYRRYLVNHEVGHALGHGHVSCPGSGQLAPVMQQQTYGLDGCLPNPWPNPT